MTRVTNRAVLISTPIHRLEFTLPDGRPKNPWHLREWSYEEFDAILNKLSGVRIEWHFLDGPWEGPFTVSKAPGVDTLALAPGIVRV